MRSCRNPSAGLDQKLVVISLFQNVLNVFLQTPIVFCHDLCSFKSDITDMPGFCNEACEFLLIFGKVDDKAVFVTVLMKPLLLLGSGKAHARNGNIKGQTCLMFTGACRGDRVISGGKGTLA